uniref:Uncharacterized protein n=1 Tax=Arundo donax TaxID=35708 RepID=A0A0A9F511_ARUDO
MTTVLLIALPIALITISSIALSWRRASA